MEWKDYPKHSKLLDEQVKVAAMIDLLPTGKYLWQTFAKPGNAEDLADADTASSLATAKLAAVAALPKSKGLRWEEDGEGDVVYRDGDDLLAWCEVSRDKFRAEFSAITRTDLATCKRAIEAAVAVLRGAPADPAPDAETGIDGGDAYAAKVMEWFAQGSQETVRKAISATYEANIAAARSDAVKADRLLIHRQLLARNDTYRIVKAFEDALAAIDAETSQR